MKSKKKMKLISSSVSSISPAILIASRTLFTIHLHFTAPCHSNVIKLAINLFVSRTFPYLFIAAQTYTHISNTVSGLGWFGSFFKCLWFSTRANVHLYIMIIVIIRQIKFVQKKCRQLRRSGRVAMLFCSHSKRQPALCECVCVCRSACGWYVRVQMCMCAHCSARPIFSLRFESLKTPILFL